MLSFSLHALGGGVAGEPRVQAKGLAHLMQPLVMFN